MGRRTGADCHISIMGSDLWLSRALPFPPLPAIDGSSSFLIRCFQKQTREEALQKTNRAFCLDNSAPPCQLCKSLRLGPPLVGQQITLQTTATNGISHQGKRCRGAMGRKYYSVTTSGQWNK